ncbi:sensor domain-containing diguanylate cyclase [Halomonas sp. H10-9-1]|uniref:sensor domain-containing diguanylate cyclase n=1 Tax=Halomonas sp. H10-9-1 TaxID=2950871 RepID=UPI0032DF8FA2
MHRHIRILAALGILITGLLAGLTTALPFYQAARTSVEETTRLGAEAQAAALHHELTRYVDIARQLASRSEIRMRLEQYTLGEVSLPALQRFTEPRLNDALDESRDIRGILRLGPADEAIAQLGTPPFLAMLPALAQVSDVATCRVTLIQNDPSLLQTCLTIVGHQGQPIGRDILVFSTERLAALLADGRRFGPNVRQVLVEQSSGLQLTATASGASLAPLDPAHSAPHQAVYRVPLETPGWELRVAIPDTDILHAVWDQLLWPVIAVGLLALLGTAIVSHALAPLLTRVARQAQRLAETDEELRQAASVFRHAHEAIAITDADQHLLDINPAFTRLLGYSPEAVQGKALMALVVDAPETLAPGGGALARGDAWQGEIHYRRADGSTLAALQTISTVRDELGEPRRHIHIFNDITAQKAAEAEVQHRALHDELTGLPNRLHLEQHLAQALRLARREGIGLAVLFLDLDHFKEVNDSLGHAAGDDLLRAVTRRLRGALREADFLARLGGDEFVVVLMPLDDDRGAIRVAAKLIDALTPPFALDGHEIHIGVSVGIAHHPEDGDDGHVLLEAADAAMYRAKQAGRNTWRQHTSHAGPSPA